MVDDTAPRVFLKPGGDKRIRAGHPWVYSNELRMDAEAKALSGGSPAVLCRVDGKPLGVGTFNPHALIAFRLFDRDPGTRLDTGFLVSRLQATLDLRDRLFDAPYYRLVHAEADGLPGLVVDRFGDVLAVQANTAGMEALTEPLLQALDQVVAPRAVVLRNDSRAWEREGLETWTRVAAGAVDGPVEIREGTHTFFADPLTGQKTGWFFDQRDNRAFLAPLCRERRMLDVYSYGGGFGVRAAALGAADVTVVDSAETALDLGRAAAEANGVADICRFRKADAFEELARLRDAGERFGVVCADPPAFVKSKKDLKPGLKGYRKLTEAAVRLVESGGLLFIASCSHNVEPAAFLQAVAQGLSRAGRGGRVLRQAGAGPDHPVHPHLPESAYLKALVLQVD